MQKQIEIEAKKGRDTFKLKENLCIAYIEEKNAEKVEELAKTGTFSDFVYHRIIDMYTERGSTELALAQFDQVRSIRPNFKLNRSGTARLAHAMYKENREWFEIIRLLIQNKQQRSEGRNVNDMNHFLQTVANAGNPAELTELFDVMIANNLLVNDTNAAGFMVRVHLVNKDVPSALRTFERQFEEHKFTPNYVPLMAALIGNNDMDGLQRVFKCLQAKFSKGNNVLELATSLLNIGNIEQARVVLKHSYSHITDHDFRRHCERYSKFGQYDMLQNLLAATVGLEYDRSIIYSSLLAYYCAQNQTAQVLDLWRTQRDQHEKPSRHFLLGLASYLKEKSLNVPFTVPEPEQPLVPSYMSAGGILETERAIKEGDADAALEQWQEVSPNSSRYFILSSQLVQLLSTSELNRKKEAMDVAIRSINLNRRVSDDALRNLIQRLSSDGESQLIEKLGDLLPIPTKRSIQFGSELVKAYEQTGNWDDFFSTTLTKKRMNANVSDRIPMEDLLTLLQKQAIPLLACEFFFHVQASNRFQNYQ